MKIGLPAVLITLLVIAVGVASVFAYWTLSPQEAGSLITDEDLPAVSEAKTEAAVETASLETKEPGTAAAPAQVLESPSQSTYSDSKYGFALTYPASFSKAITTDQSGASTVTFTMPTQDLAAQCSSCRSASVQVIVSDNPESVSKCSSFPEEYSGDDSGLRNTGTVVINGVSFISFISGSGAGVSSTQTSYRTEKDGACYLIRTDLRYLQDPEKKRSAIQTSLEAVARSFQFK